MLKKRIIPILLIKNGRLVKGAGFSNYRDVGDPVSSARIYNSQQADELVILNTDIEQGIEPTLSLIEEISEVVFMPVTFGGGVRDFDDAKKLITRGADKVVLNTCCYQDPGVITQIAEHFGRQAVVVGIDVRRQVGEWKLFSENGMVQQDVSLERHIQTIQDAGAGELLVQSIDNDGHMAGFDLRLAREAGKFSNIPVILAGGSGNYEHLRQVFIDTDVSAVACGSLFNFSDSNPMRAMSYLRNYGLPFKRV
jgi:cyclase